MRENVGSESARSKGERKMLVCIYAESVYERKRERHLNKRLWRGVYLKLGVIIPLQAQNIRQKWSVHKFARFPRHRDAVAVYRRASYNSRW